LTGEKRIKVSEEDWKALQRAKLSESETFKKQLRKNRERELKVQQMRVGQIKREIDFKKKQLADGKSVEKHEAYVDGAKPLFHIENDVEQLSLDLENAEDNIKLIKEAMDDSDRA